MKTQISMLDKSYKKIGINAALVCATVHHSSHLGLSSLQSPHAFCTILAFSIHSFIYSVNGEFGPTLMCLLIKIGRDTRCTHMPHMHAHNSLTLMC